MLSPGLFLCRPTRTTPSRRPSHHVVGFPPDPWHRKSAIGSARALPCAAAAAACRGARAFARPRIFAPWCAVRPDQEETPPFSADSGRCFRCCFWASQIYSAASDLGGDHHKAGWNLHSGQHGRTDHGEPKARARGGCCPLRLGSGRDL